MSKSFNEWVKGCKQRVEVAAGELLPPTDLEPKILHEAMRYSVIGGGKRVRPLLVYAVSELFGADEHNADRVALAIECVHSYSLIHDDLPCMDNDMLRHGKPTTHAKYGEAMAMLAGDALQPEAFIYISETTLNPHQKLVLISLLADAASSRGMCGGQAIDLSMVGKKMTLEELRHMHALKTGTLLHAAVMSGIWCAKEESSSEELIEALSSYGNAVGLLFQIVDDILDVVSSAEKLGKTAGKDALENKPTYVSILGLDKSRELAKEQYELALASVQKIENIVGGNKTLRLREIADFIYSRDH
ncbi:polyprenyl synthetase family protein [Turicimonas muris]